MYINFRRTKEKCVFLFLIRVPADGPFFPGRFGRIILMVCFCFVELYYSAFSQATGGVSKTGSLAAAAETVVVPQTDVADLPPCVGIKSFGSVAGGGIINGFMVVRHLRMLGPPNRPFPSTSNSASCRERGLCSSPGSGSKTTPTAG